MKEEKISFEDVLIWIVSNSEDEEAMERINKLTFQFTSKYRGRSRGEK